MPVNIGKSNILNNSKLLKISKFWSVVLENPNPGSIIILEKPKPSSSSIFNLKNEINDCHAFKIEWSNRR